MVQNSVAFKARSKIIWHVMVRWNRLALMSTHKVIVQSDYAIVVCEITPRVRTLLRPPPGCQPGGETIIHHTIWNQGVSVSLPPMSRKSNRIVVVRERAVLEGTG